MASKGTLKVRVSGVLLVLAVLAEVIVAGFLIRSFMITGKAPGVSVPPEQITPAPKPDPARPA